jgi:hypothetical protein
LSVLKIYISDLRNLKKGNKSSADKATVSKRLQDGQIQDTDPGIFRCEAGLSESQIKIIKDTRDSFETDCPGGKSFRGAFKMLRCLEDAITGSKIYTSPEAITQAVRKVLRDVTYDKSKLSFPGEDACNMVIEYAHLASLGLMII